MTTTYNRINIFIFAMIANIALLSSSSQAALIPLDNLDDSPDIAAGFIDGNYDSTTDTFTLSGFAFSFDDDGVGAAENITGGTFDLTSVINVAGDLTSGTFSVGGTIPTLGLNSGTLLTGNLTDFGFVGPPGGNPMEFLFEVTGGDAASYYGGVGSEGGIIVSPVGSFNGTFTNDFAFTSSTADVKNVPEPSSVLIMLIGLCGLIIPRWHLKSKKQV